jgi:hypothetical protein
MSDRSLPEEASALFREPPEMFISARDALARRLGDDGRVDDAATIKALRKPTVAAWALNQLAEGDPDGVRALVDAGAEVRAAQQAALSSKRGATERLREATAARRTSVARLASVAVEALARTGRGADAHTEAIVHGLEAASVDPAAGESLIRGTFERPPAAPAGFGNVFGLSSVDGEGGDETERPTVAEPARPRRTKAGAGRSTELTELRAEVARLRRDRDAAVRRARKSRSTADGFAHELEGMRRRLDVVERKHADASSAAGEAELEAARAERALAEADERLDEAEPPAD